MFQVIVETRFAAAHRLRGYKGTCEELHGHNWKVEVAVEGEELDETGLLLDFRELKSAARDAVGELDHKYLNELPRFRELNPTTENIARMLAEDISGRIGAARARVVWVRAWESESSSVIYRP